MELTEIKYGATRNGVYLEASADLEIGETAFVSYNELEALVQRELIRQVVK